MTSPAEPPNGGGPVSLAEQIARILRELSGQWIPPASADWSQWQRFIPAVAGSFTFFLFVPWSRLMKAETLERQTELLERILPIAPAVAGFQLTLAIVGTLWFGYLASFGEHPRGPARLYFTGLFLPALATGVITAVLHQ